MITFLADEPELDPETRRSLWRQDRDFCERMLRAVRAHLEHPPMLGIDVRPGTSKPMIFGHKD